MSTRSADPFTLERQLCDASGMVSHELCEPNAFAPGLTFLRQLNNLRAHTGLAPVADPFHCTGSAHLAAEHIRCTSPAHSSVLAVAGQAECMPPLCLRPAGHAGFHFGSAAL